MTRPCFYFTGCLDSAEYVGIAGMVCEVHEVHEGHSKQKPLPTAQADSGRLAAGEQNPTVMTPGEQ